MRILLTIILNLSGIPVCAQAVPDLPDMSFRLQQPETSQSVVPAIESLCMRNPSAKAQLEQRLPAMLLDAEDPTVVQSEANLADHLQFESAIPTLIELLSRANQPYLHHTITSYSEMRDDPVARSLFDLHVPVPLLVAPLGSDHIATRKRAIRLLLLIGTPESYSMLMAHKVTERDPDLMKILQMATQTGSVK